MSNVLDELTDTCCSVLQERTSRNGHIQLQKMMDEEKRGDQHCRANRKRTVNKQGHTTHNSKQ